MTIEEIARVCHEANRGLQAVQQAPGIPVAPSWDAFPVDEQLGVISGVRLALEGQTAEQLHAAWCEYKLTDGWVYGAVKDAEAKTHPCLVPYDQLPASQKLKDHLFAAVVTALVEGPFDWAALVVLRKG